VAIKKTAKLDRDLPVAGTDSFDYSDLGEFRTQLKKEFGNSAALEDDDFVTDFIPTKIEPLDYLLGGGIPQGKVTEIVGLEGVGKSSFGIYMLGQIQKQGGLGVLIDTESGAGDRFRFENFGVDTHKCIVSVEDLAEKAFMQVERVANYISKKNIKAPSLLVLDSIAGLTTRAEQEADLDQAQFAVTARMIKRGLQRTKMVCRETNLAVLAINQARVKMGSVATAYSGPEYTSPGGDTLKYLAITRLFLTRGSMLGEPKKPEGHIVKAKFIKCKTAASLGRTLPLRFYYDSRGYDSDLSTYDVLNDAGIFGKSAWKSIVMPDGTERKWNSADNFVELITATPENRAYFTSLMKKCFVEQHNFVTREATEEPFPQISEALTTED
jgi:RecA/RadA recombinase